VPKVFICGAGTGIVVKCNIGLAHWIAVGIRRTPVIRPTAAVNDWVTLALVTSRRRQFAHGFSRHMPGCTQMR
jgi:hypothetical protein